MILTKPFLKSRVFPTLDSTYLKSRVSLDYSASAFRLISIDPFFYELETLWLGASYIVRRFIFSNVPNNFSIIKLPKVPITIDYENVNFCLCISWKDDEGNVIRYKLWKDVGEVLFADLYSIGTLISADTFQLELWSVDSTPIVSLSETLKIITSLITNPNSKEIISEGSIFMPNFVVSKDVFILDISAQDRIYTDSLGNYYISASGKIYI